MDVVYATRRANLTRLGDEKFEGVRKELAAAINRPPSQVSRWLTKDAKQRKLISEGIARKLESTLGLPRLWLDQEHQQETNTPTHSETGNLISVAAPIAAPRKGTRYVPVRGTLRMGLIMTEQDAVQFVEWVTGDNSSTFAVHIDSDTYAPRLRRNECIIMETNRDIRVGNQCMYKLREESSLHVGELLAASTETYRFGSINPSPTDKPLTVQQAHVEWCHPITAIVDADLASRIPGKAFI